jgi:hypothetical protein
MYLALLAIAIVLLACSLWPAALVVAVVWAALVIRRYNRTHLEPFGIGVLW